MICYVRVQVEEDEEEDDDDEEEGGGDIDGDVD